MRIYKIDKKVLSFRSNPVEFLNGLTSNDMEKPNNAFLSIHGRIVATFDQIKRGDDEMLIVVEKEFVQDVTSHLDRYLKISGTKMTEKSDLVYFDLDNDMLVHEDDVTIPQKSGKLIITQGMYEVNVEDDEYTLFRLKNDIPCHGIDYTDEMLLNVSTKDYISFTKGCFLGQEPISKVHNRSKPSWKLVVRYQDQCSEEERGKMTSVVLDPESNQDMGFVFIKN